MPFNERLQKLAANDYICSNMAAVYQLLTATICGGPARPSVTSVHMTVYRFLLRRSIAPARRTLVSSCSSNSTGDENTQQSDEEIVLAALDGTADGKLTGLALRIVLSDHTGIPHENQPDFLTEAEQVFVPKKPKAVKTKVTASKKAKAPAVKTTAKKLSALKKAA